MRKMKHANVDDLLWNIVVRVYFRVGLKLIFFFFCKHCKQSGVAKGSTGVYFETHNLIISTNTLKIYLYNKRILKL